MKKTSMSMMLAVAVAVGVALSSVQLAAASATPGLTSNVAGDDSRAKKPKKPHVTTGVWDPQSTTSGTYKDDFTAMVKTLTDLPENGFWHGTGSFLIDRAKLWFKLGQPFEADQRFMINIPVADNINWPNGLSEGRILPGSSITAIFTVNTTKFLSSSITLVTARDVGDAKKSTTTWITNQVEYKYRVSQKVSVGKGYTSTLRDSVTNQVYDWIYTNDAPTPYSPTSGVGCFTSKVVAFLADTALILMGSEASKFLAGLVLPEGLAFTAAAAAIGTALSGGAFYANSVWSNEECFGGKG